jgi:hypothetical protein
LEDKVKEMDRYQKDIFFSENIKIINEIIEDYNILDLDECSKYNIGDIKSNIFIKNKYEEIDKLTLVFEEAISHALVYL